MEIIKVHESEIALWCELWHVQEMALHTHFIRSMSNQYFKERYLKADLKEGYCIKVEGRIVGFFGVQHEQIDGHTALVFSDFIIDPKYRMKGYLKETIQCLLDGFFENIDLFIFFPINREAMITWKFALRPKIIQNINSWCIALNKRDKEVDVYLEVQEISQCKDLWLYSEEEYYCRKIVSHKQPMGEFIYREIVHNGKKGAEIVRLNSLEINRIEEALNIVSAYLYEEGYEYMLIKVHEGANEYFEKLPQKDKYLETKYMFVIENNQAHHAELEKLYGALGEPYDLPRTDEVIKKFYNEE